MTRRTWMIAAGILAGVLLLAWWLWPASPTEDLGVVDGLAGEAVETPEPIDDTVEQTSLDLYFPGEAGKLYAESRMLPVVDETTEQIQILIDALLDGPESPSLRPPLTEGARLRQVYLMGGTSGSTSGSSASAGAAAEDADTSIPSLEGQTVVLDFETVGGMPPRTTGSQRERLMVYSLVNSTLLNFIEGRGVLILWNGQQNVTFGGHLDIGRPLGADISLIARQEPPPYSPDQDELPALFDLPAEEPETEAASDAGIPANEPTTTSEETVPQDVSGMS